jgi:hypothetical protein
MRIKTNVKAGKIALNHNQTVKRLRVKSKIKAGIPGDCDDWGCGMNHNQAIRRLRVRSNVKAGRIALNHNQTLAW